MRKKKKLYRNHGKAILIDPYSENKNVSEKERLYVEEKRLIGAAAAQLVTPRDSILIASGTTVHALARNIHTTDKLTVITASLEVARILANDHNVDIIADSHISPSTAHAIEEMGIELTIVPVH